MEFTPFQFIDEVLLSLFTTTSKKRTASSLDASVLLDFATYWGEQAEQLRNSHFDLTIYYCDCKQKSGDFIDGSTTVSICPDTRTFVKDYKTFLRNLTIRDQCRCSRNGIRKSLIFSVLSNFMNFTGILPQKATINFERESTQHWLTLGSVFENNFWAILREIHVKLSNVSRHRDGGFIQRFVDNNRLRSFELENSTRNEKRNIRRYVKKFILAWISTQDKENCMLSVVCTFVSMQELMAEMLHQFGVVSRPSPNEYDASVITVTGCDKQLILKWQFRTDPYEKGSLKVLKF
ncbi:hypothetical protein L596_017065 [Steinernema carpocapsae]|uniref:Uncharacterized protein n=1 Tax=Steinernema carpocapsae TaxID=34508 RepID=A0A4U5N0Q9_STECR|nr:hypothetical protein L596_017065 [Steinernema carpocapsae]